MDRSFKSYIFYNVFYHSSTRITIQPDKTVTTFCWKKHFLTTGSFLFGALIFPKNIMKLLKHILQLALGLLYFNHSKKTIEFSPGPNSIKYSKLLARDQIISISATTLPKVSLD